MSIVRILKSNGRQRKAYLDAETHVLAVSKLFGCFQVVGDKGAAASILHRLFHGLIKLKQIQRKLDPWVLQLP